MYINHNFYTMSSLRKDNCRNYFLCAIFIIFLQVKCLAIDDGGFGSQFPWMTLEEGLEQAKSEEKPLMLIIHKSWCGACKALKPKFAESAHIESLSKHFIMVNAGDDDEPQDKKYAPDGSYIPRIYFLDSSGTVQEDIYNEEGNSNYKYYYFNTESIVSSMKKAIEKLSGAKKMFQDEL